MKDYYSILGVSKDADEVVIKAAYKALAQKHHPDKYDKGSGEQSSRLMTDINKAYSVFGSPVSRQKYDQELFGNNHPDIQMKAAAAKPKQPAPVYEKQESEPEESRLLTIIFCLAIWAVGIYYMINNLKV